MSLSPSPHSATPPTSRPWWTVGMVWLMLGGPAVVVIASIFTAVLAYRGHDTLVPRDAEPHTAPASLHLPAEEAHEHDTH